MNDKKRCLIIGLGQIGMGYDFDSAADGGVYTHARAIDLHPTFELVGGVDPAEGQRQRFEAKYGARAFADVGSAMDAIRPQVVIIATPADMHRCHVDAVLAQHRPEILICEKPLAFDLGEGEAIIRGCEDAGVPVFVNYIRRSDPGALEVRRRFEAGEIAVPVKGAFWYSKGFINNGSHFLNLLQDWIGEVKRFTVLNPGRRWAGVDPEPDVQIEFERGTVVMQAAWEEAFSFYGGELLSPSGRLSYGDGGSSISWKGLSPNGGGGGQGQLSVEVENIENDMDRYQLQVYEQLSRFLTGQPHELCSGREALATLRVVSAIAERCGDML